MTPRLSGSSLDENEVGQTAHNKTHGEEAVAEGMDTGQTVIKAITQTVMKHNKETVILRETIKGVKIGIITG